MYRAQDEEWMNKVKESVLGVTKGVMEKEDRKWSLDYLRSHVKLDDLRALALKKFPGKVIDFGEGSFNPKIVVLTKERITPEQKDKLRKGFLKMGIEDGDVFYSYLRFVKTNKKKEERQEILEKLLNTLKPEVIVKFDKVKVDSKCRVFDTNLDIAILTDKERKEERKALTKELRECADSLVG